jgi:hypothetical protein
MVLSNFFCVKGKDLCFPSISCEKDPNHKTFDYYDKKKHPTQYVDNAEALFLIKQARDSFLSYKKIKDTHMKKKYIKAGLSPEQIKRHFYLSNDKKFYCIYFNITDDDAVLYYIFGIIERSTGKHLMIVREFWSGSYDALYIEHDMFDYYAGDNYLEKTCGPKPSTMLSFDTKEILDNHYKPHDIIDSLEDYFVVLFEELFELN